MFTTTKVTVFIASEEVPGHVKTISCPFMEMPKGILETALGCADLTMKKTIFHHGGNDFHWQDEPLRSSYALTLDYNPGGTEPLYAVARLIKAIHTWLPDTYSFSAHFFGKAADRGVVVPFVDYSYEVAKCLLKEQRLNWLRFCKLCEVAKDGDKAIAEDLMGWGERYQPVMFAEFDLKSFQPDSVGMRKIRQILQDKEP